jgi:hypothetical protein
MTELLDRFLSPSALREVIRAKRRDGVPPETISRLVACYVPVDIAAKSECSERLAVELIPPDCRAFFFEALQHLPSRHSLTAQTGPGGSTRGGNSVVRR